MRELNDMRLICQQIIILYPDMWLEVLISHTFLNLPLFADCASAPRMYYICIYTISCMEIKYYTPLCGFGRVFVETKHVGASPRQRTAISIIMEQ